MLKKSACLSGDRIAVKKEEKERVSGSAFNELDCSVAQPSTPQTQIRARVRVLRRLHPHHLLPHSLLSPAVSAEPPIRAARSQPPF